MTECTIYDLAGEPALIKLNTFGGEVAVKAHVTANDKRQLQPRIELSIPHSANQVRWGRALMLLFASTAELLTPDTEQWLIQPSYAAQPERDHAVVDVALESGTIAEAGRALAVLRQIIDSDRRLINARRAHLHNTR